MKHTVKLFLVIVLFCATAFADGDGNMGSGGRTCTSNCPTPVQSTVLPENEKETDSSDSMIKFIQEYLVSIFG